MLSSSEDSEDADSRSVLYSSIINARAYVQGASEGNIVDVRTSDGRR